MKESVKKLKEAFKIAKQAEFDITRYVKDAQNAYEFAQIFIKKDERKAWIKKSLDDITKQVLLKSIGLIEE